MEISNSTVIKSRDLMLVKSKFTRQLETGEFKRVSAQHVVNGITFTDSEAMIYHALESVARGEFRVIAMQRLDFTAVIRKTDQEQAAQSFFKVKFSYAPIDDEGNPNKTVSQTILIEARDTKQADAITREYLEIEDYRGYAIDSIVLTKIEDVFFYSETPEVAQEDVITDEASPSGVYQDSGEDEEDHF
jgi:hypothetical protein